MPSAWFLGQLKLRRCEKHCLNLYRLSVRPLSCVGTRRRFCTWMPIPQDYFGRSVDRGCRNKEVVQWKTRQKARADCQCCAQVGSRTRRPTNASRGLAWSGIRPTGPICFENPHTPIDFCPRLRYNRTDAERRSRIALCCRHAYSNANGPRSPHRLTRGWQQGTFIRVPCPFLLGQRPDSGRALPKGHQISVPRPISTESIRL